MPVGLHVRLHHNRSLVNNPLAVPDLDRDSDAIVVVKPHSGRHPVVSRTGIHSPGYHLIVINPAALFSLPGLASVKRADHYRLRSGHIVDEFL